MILPETLEQAPLLENRTICVCICLQPRIQIMNDSCNFCFYCSTNCICKQRMLTSIKKSSFLQIFGLISCKTFTLEFNQVTYLKLAFSLEIGEGIYSAQFSAP